MSSRPWFISTGMGTQAPGATLYIRPDDDRHGTDLGVKPSSELLLLYYHVPGRRVLCRRMQSDQDLYQRTVCPGGKRRSRQCQDRRELCGLLYMSEIAKKAGCTQVLWLDACEHNYVEEVGTSNIFFLNDDQLITPPLEGSILGGITRDSVLKLAADWGFRVGERRITIDEVLAANKEGNLQEVFGTGTAAVISPVGEFCTKTKHIDQQRGGPESWRPRLYRGTAGYPVRPSEDPFNWLVRVG